MTTFFALGLIIGCIAAIAATSYLFMVVLPVRKEQQEYLRTAPRNATIKSKTYGKNLRKRDIDEEIKSMFN